MRKNMEISRKIWLCLPLLLGACLGGSPPVRYFLLTPTPAAVAPVVKGGTEKPVLVVEPVELPPYLNRSQIVTRNSENHLHLAQTEQWGDNLRENISRVLLENLSALLGTDRISSPVVLVQERPAWRVATQVSQFERGADGKIVLKARWRLVEGQTGKVALVRHVHLTSDPVGLTDYEAVAAGMSGLLWQWSQEMAKEMATHIR
ncbi:MAG: PqiC family protein [Magnetococcus sp. XQGC-1]